jgi:large subunit ribosomal protein L29
MPIIRIKEVREMSSENRLKKLGELGTELLRLRTMIRAGGTIENPARVRILRKAVARILTIENEQRLAAGKEKRERRKQK